MNKDQEEALKIQEFQEQIINDYTKNIKDNLNLVKLMVPGFNANENIDQDKWDKIETILKTGFRPHISRCFELLSNEDILFWMTVYNLTKDPRYISINQKLTPVFTNAVERYTQKIMDVILGEQ